MTEQIQDKEPCELNTVDDGTSSTCPAQLLAQYGHAVLHVATLRLTNPEGYLLLFALIELFPNEIAARVSTSEPKRLSLPGSPKRYAFMQRIALPVESAIRWYRSCLDSNPIIEYQGKRIEPKVFHLQSEPPWPHFVCVDNNLTIPFLAGWHGTPRISQLISLSFALYDYLNEAQRKALENFLHDELHFQIGNYPSLWGSVNLILPNPVIRKFSGKLKETSDPTGDTIVFKLRPRLNAPPSDLEVQICEKRPSGFAFHKFTPENYGTHAFKLPYALEGHHTYLISKRLGLLHSRGPAVFIRAVRANVNISIAERRLRVGSQTVAVSVTNSTADTTEETLPSPELKYQDARTKLLEERSRQRAHQEGKSLGQQWFAQDRQGAVLAILDKLRHAQRSVLIIDSYFGHEELVFVNAVGNLKVPIQILTSAMHLRNSPKQTESTEKMPKYGTILSENLRRISNDQYANTIDVRVLGGDTSPIHDRFLLIDDAVWLLGNSLNGFGKTLSTMVVLPDPAPLKQELTKYWDSAQGLPSWIKNRE